ncbi:MAG TPA: autotransporter-associated beta strand repeat-containing protein [Chthoniobacterales bacterium]|nr:autotransporter-associated beta strand repeat-containing protein [Chthoniobacterales bacterium]
MKPASRSARLLCAVTATALALSTAAGGTVTYNLRDFNSSLALGSGNGTFNSGYATNALGIFAHDVAGGGNTVRRSVFQTLTTTGSGTTGTARPLQIGDEFTVSLHLNTVSFSDVPGIYFNDNTTYTNSASYNTNNRLSITLDDDGNWYLNNAGTRIDTGVDVGTDIQIKVTVTSSNTFNLTVNNTLVASDILMAGAPSATSFIQSIAIVQEDDKNNGSNTDLVAFGSSLTNTGTVTLGAKDNSGTISGVIKDGFAADSTSTVSSNSVVKNGTGTIVLSPSGASNTYTGTTTVNAGTLQATSTAALPGYNTAGKVTANSGGTMAVSAGGAGQWTAPDIDTLRSNATFNAGSFLGIDTTGGNFTYNSAMTQSFGLTKMGTNTLTLGGANGYTGATNVLNGTLQLGGSNVLPSGTTVTLGNSATNTAGVLDLNGNSQTLAGLLSVGSGTNLVQTNTGTTGVLTLNIASGTNTYGGLLGTGSTNRGFALIKNGGGTLALTNNSSAYNQGTTINAGVISISAFGALGSTAASNVLTLDGGTLQITGSTSRTTANITINAGGGTFDITSGTTTLNNLVNGVGTLTKTGAATLTLANAANSFVGLNINGGTVSSTVQGAIGTGGLSFNTGTLSIDTNAQSYSNNVTLAGAGTINAGANATWNGNFTNGANRLTVSGAGTTTFGGTITSSTDVLKQGSGTAIFNTDNSATWAGANATSTNLFIDSGTVQVAANGALGATNGTNTGRIALGASNSANAGTVSLLLTTPGMVLANPMDVRYYSAAPSAKSIGSSGAGLFEYSGSLTLHDSVTLTAGANGITRFSGVIATGTAGVPYTGPNVEVNTNNLLFSAGPGVIITGPGTVEFTNANTYGGETYIKSGTLTFNGGTSSMGDTIRLGENNVSSNATVNISTGGTIINNVINPRPGGGTKTISGTNAANTTATYSGTVALDASTIVTSTNDDAILSFDGVSKNFDIKFHTLTVNGDGDTTIVNPLIAGTLNPAVTGTGGSLIKSGTGTLILQNTNNTYTGTIPGNLNANGTQISGGVLGIYGATSLGLAPSGAYNNIQFTGSGTLQDTANNITLGTTRNISITSGATATFDSNGNTFTIQGIINGAGALAKSGTGTVTLSGANTYNGGTTINLGTLSIGSTAQLGASGTGITFNGGTLQITGGTNTSSRPILFNSTGTIDITTGNFTFSSGAFTGTGGLTKIGAGILTLGDGASATANTYAGLTKVNAGELDLNKGTGAGGVNAFGGNIEVNGGTLKWLQNEQMSNTGTITLNSGMVDLNGKTEIMGSFINNGGTFVTGTGGQLRGTTSTIEWNSGTNTINSGGLVADNHIKITGGTNVVENNGILRLTGGGAGFEITGADLTLNAGATPGKFELTGTPNVSDITSTASNTTSRILSSGAGTAGTIDFMAATRTVTVNDGGAAVDLQISARILNGSLIKEGAGVLQLSGPNNHGTTTINAGTVQADAGSLVSVTGNVTVNNGGTLLLSGSGRHLGSGVGVNLNGGTFDTGGLSEPGGAVDGTQFIGALTLTASSTISFGAGNSSILEFAGLGTHTMNTVLSITNWDGVPLVGGSGDRLLFNGSIADFTTAYNQSDVMFNGTSGYTAIQIATGMNPYYEIVGLTPIPEPGTWVAGAMTFGGLLLLSRRRIWRRRLPNNR